ncbi:MAG: helix-turn-helix transcriptional regulator [Polyangiaceae bacterium]|nr:helix-turn-helix transcriptional regulator [Polyangiaceae bacterium]
MHLHWTSRSAKVARVTPDDLKALRKELACTAKELAQALGIEQATVLAWEKGELFPTKPAIDKMEQLRARGPAAIPKKSKGEGPMRVLADPALWAIVRKLLANKKLRDEVTKLAAAYPDPADE